MHWITTTAIVSDRQAGLRADAERLRAGRDARRRRARARRGDEARGASDLATRRNGHAPRSLAPSTTC